MNFSKRSILVSVATLPFAIAVPPALADAGVHTDVDISDGLENSVLDVGLTSQDDDGERFGVRSRNHFAELDEFGTDTRAVTEGEDGGLSTRAILGFNQADDVDSDLDLVILDDHGEPESARDDLTGAEETYSEDSRYVFGD